MNIRLHAFEPASRANGPGLRAVLWFQGCTLGCAGCFNPGTHDPHGGYGSDTAQIAAAILDLDDKIEGLSISGGEPFQQPEALLDLLHRLDGAGLGRLVFTGYTLDEIQDHLFGPRILQQVDVLIAGRYDRSQPTSRGLLGSANQQIHLLTNRYSLSQLTGGARRELILRPDGTVTATGLAPWKPPQMTRVAADPGHRIRQVRHRT
ncbi:MAG: 4Fe-4S single cluster domain-containing protein [Planctomycetota bacterium]